MLTRIEVDGFKNLVGVDIRLGPMTCIGGPNGVGKSNLFDAIHLLALLADKPFLEALGSVRGGDSIRDLFTSRMEPALHLSAEMVIPEQGVDEFGQVARAGSTYLRYELHLSLEASDGGFGADRVRLLSESLTHIPKGQASNAFVFETNTKAWMDAVIVPTRRGGGGSFISTVDHGTVVRLHADRMRSEKKEKRGGGRPTEFNAETLPRTVLSSAQHADECRTAVLVRREMRQWRMLQLEPRALRQADDFDAPDRLDAHGAHIPRTLARLAGGAASGVDPSNRRDGIAQQDGASRASESTGTFSPKRGSRPPDTHAAAREATYARLANRLSELVQDVDTVLVDRDDARRSLVFRMRDRHGVELPAGALSDGTLRFVALALLEADDSETGLICLEEPENGIHPERIGAMVDLLYGIAVDPTAPATEDNPLRQVLVSTHSPLVMAEMRDNDVLFATSRRVKHGDETRRALTLRCLDGTRRASKATRDHEATISRGTVEAYLQGSALFGAASERSPDEPTRVKDRLQRQQLTLTFSDPPPR